MKIAAAVVWAAGMLERKGVVDPRRDASSLMMFILNKDRAFLIAHSEEELTPAKTADFVAAVHRRASREPFQYIVGNQEFCGYDFEVRPGVLIPRPETEMLVKAAIETLGNIGSPRFLEIGIGSGCISVSVLRQFPSAFGVGIDISEDSVALAATNAEQLGVGDRLDLKAGDLFGPVEGRTFHAIISNPPYVPVADLAKLQAEVRDFEPRAALTDGGTGLSIIKRIVDEAPNFLVTGGYLILEFGYGQSASVEKLFDRTVWVDVEVRIDFRSVERMVVARLALG